MSRPLLPVARTREHVPRDDYFCLAREGSVGRREAAVAPRPRTFNLLLVLYVYFVWLYLRIEMVSFFSSLPLPQVWCVHGRVSISCWRTRAGGGGGGGAIREVVFRSIAGQSILAASVFALST